MKQYAVELKRTSYVVIFINAESKEEAEASALDSDEYAKCRKLDDEYATYEVDYAFEGKEITV